MSLASIPPDAAFALALSDACEDYFGLYELVWEFNGKFATADQAARLAAAQVAVTRLVRAGLAAVFRAHWKSDEYEELGTEIAVAILAEAASWRSPAETPESSYYCFTSTPAGDALYFGRPDSTPAAG